MKIKRGGKHLEYFKENRIINDYLVKDLKALGLWNDEMLAEIKQKVRKLCEEFPLYENL